ARFDQLHGKTAPTALRMRHQPRNEADPTATRQPEDAQQGYSDHLTIDSDELATSVPRQHEPGLRHRKGQCSECRDIRMVLRAKIPDLLVA
ncbi:hypothetical protein RZS08_31075, partial [Arthrospira platensis SPKY1]|nr:hypothetical protein [Arthrospira platensis SPKY1]